jgi:carbohydrate-selective porin OprB
MGESVHSLMSMNHQLIHVSGAAFLLLSICVAQPADAQTTGDNLSTSWSNSAYMFGDWGGERTALERNGIVFNFLSVNDLLLDSRSDVANWSRVRGTLDVDFGKAELVQGLTFHITALWQGGGNLGGYIGSIANPSSLVSANTTRLDSWWFQQALAHNKVFVRLGQFAGLDFYGVQLDGASYVMEPLAYAIGNLFAADYESFDPAGTPAAEVRYVPSKHIYVKSAIFSGNRNPYRDDISGVNWKFKDNPVIAAEAGYLVEPTPSSTVKTYPGTYRFGATTNPGPFPNIVTGRRSSGSYLLYFMANQAVYRSHAGSDRGLDANFAFDWTPDDITRNYSQITAGLHYRGLIPRRRQDTVAVGLVYSRISGVLNQALSQAGLLRYGTEKALEVNYSLQVTRWFTFQPVFQYYFDTGANPFSRNNSVAGFRTTFVL